MHDIFAERTKNCASFFSSLNTQCIRRGKQIDVIPSVQFCFPPSHYELTIKKKYT